MFLSICKLTPVLSLAQHGTTGGRSILGWLAGITALLGAIAAIRTAFSRNNKWIGSGSVCGRWYVLRPVLPSCSKTEVQHPCGFCKVGRDKRVQFTRPVRVSW